MPWPKGKPRKPRETPPEPPPAPPPPAEERGAFQPAIGPKREGGKTALAAENQELALREMGDEEKSEREQLYEKYDEMKGTPTEELSQEGNETPPASEEELSQEEAEETPPEEESQELGSEEEMIPISQLKETQNKMHEATTRAANFEKLVEEMAPAVDWKKLQLSKGEGETQPAQPTQRTVEIPSQDLFVSDYPKWHEQNTDAVAQRVVNILEERYMPQAAQKITTQTEWTRLQHQFRDDYAEVIKEVYRGDADEAEHVMNFHIQKNRKANPKASPSELYALAKPAFDERVGPRPKKSGKKVVPLEAPAKAKETAPAGPEKPMTMEDWEKEGRDYVSFKQKKIRELQGF
jgi:hypothetical protein